MKTITKFIYPAFTLFAFACFGGVAFAQQPQNGPPCPKDTLAPYGLAPDSHCDGTGCLVNFNNYQWWTAFTFNRNEGYYNGGLGTIFAPEHVVVDGEGDKRVMRLRMAKDTNYNNQWAGAEAVLMFHANGTQANLGYGDYLVSAEIVKPENKTFAELDPNVALGMFTYERPDRGSPNNPAREIDLAEISRWGWNHVDPEACPFPRTPMGSFDPETLCKENAQFALQVYTKRERMVKRYKIGPTNKITLVMRWRKGKVTFEQYNGFHKLNNLPQEKEDGWETPPELSDFVPEPGCARFHINLWLGNFYRNRKTFPWTPRSDIRGEEFSANPEPTNGEEVEVVIRNFEFQKQEP